MSPDLLQYTRPLQCNYTPNKCAAYFAQKR